jgi:signal transduction histidine kinase
MQECEANARMTQAGQAPAETISGERMRKRFFFAFPGSSWPRLRYRLIAPVLALAIFGIDAFTPIKGAIAVLYVLVMLIIADMLSRRGVILTVAMCVGLTLGAFLYQHGLLANAGAILRLSVSLSAILITGVLMLRDQADREKLVVANAELTRSERRYRAIFEQARFSLWEQDYSKVFDALTELKARGITDIAAYAKSHPEFHSGVAGLIMTTDVNDATLQLLGASRREQVLGPLAPFLPPDHPVLIEVLQAVQDGKDHHEGLGRLIGVDGASHKVLFALNFPDKSDRLERVVGTLVDITQREQTQEALTAARSELARASRAATVGALSASIAHELNQPLGALVMNAQTCLRWLRREPPDIAAASAAAQRTVEDSMRASAIVEKTRNMLVKGRQQEEVIDLRQLSSEITVLLGAELEAQGARITARVAVESPMIWASRIEMQQVLINLISNGLHAMSENPPSTREIALTIDSPGGTDIRLSIRDRGTGIKEEHLARLFDPFFTTKDEGMGMGLAICRSIVEARGGRLTARNHEEGGAVFELIIPGATEGVAKREGLHNFG